MSANTIAANPSGIALRSGLWIAQVLVFLAFYLIGAMKLFTPIPKLVEIIPWAGQYSEIFVRVIGCIDLAGGMGILLPALMRIKPGLTVAAALGCTLLQLCAIVFHLSRREEMLTPLNFLLLALSAFVLWGRTSELISRSSLRR